MTSVFVGGLSWLRRRREEMKAGLGSVVARLQTGGGGDVTSSASGCHLCRERETQYQCLVFADDWPRDSTPADRRGRINRKVTKKVA